MRSLMLKAWNEETVTPDMSWESGRLFHCHKNGSKCDAAGCDASNANTE